MVAVPTPLPSWNQPPTAYPNISQDQLAQVVNLLQRSQQGQQSPSPQATPNQFSPISTAIAQSVDPAQAIMQWAQYLPQNLPQPAATPTNNLEAQQRQYITSLEAESKAAAEYIQCLETLLMQSKTIAEFSQDQDYLINQFLHNPEFTLAYISGSWYNQKFSDEFLSGLSQLFLAISDNHPLPENQGGDSLNPQQPQQPQQPQIPQMPPLPPLPTSFNGGNINGSDLINAAKNGNPAAMAAAIQNPALMYQSLFQ